MTEIKFEDALAKLEKIVTELENGELSLDDSIKKYEDGIKLARVCSSKLESAKKKIEVLVKNSDGKFELEPFNEDETEALTEKPKKAKTKKKQPDELL